MSRDGTIYNAAGEWLPRYVLNLAGPAGSKIEISSGITGVKIEADGDAFSIAVETSATEGYAAGLYQWNLFADNGTDRVWIDRGSVTIKPDVVTAAAVDARSHAQKMLDAIEAHLEALEGGEVGVTSISIATPEGSRSFNQMPRTEIVEWRNYYRREVFREEERERRRQGLESRRHLYHRFVRS